MMGLWWQFSFDLWERETTQNCHSNFTSLATARKEISYLKPLCGMSSLEPRPRGVAARALDPSQRARHPLSHTLTHNVECGSGLYRANGRGGFGSQAVAEPLWCDPRRTPEKQTVGTVTASQKMLTPQALSSSLHAGAANAGAGCAEARLLDALWQSVPLNVHLHIIDQRKTRWSAAKWGACREHDFESLRA